MITRREVDELEGYLLDCTLNDVPRVFGKVLPTLFTEFRLLLDLLDQQTEEFFNNESKVERNRSGVLHDPRHGEGGGELLGGGEDGAAPAPPRNPSPVQRVPHGSPSDSRPDATRTGGGEAASSSGLVTGGLRETLGGEVRTDSGNQPATSGEPIDAVLKPKKKRGRPRKNPLPESK